MKKRTKVILILGILLLLYLFFPIKRGGVDNAGIRWEYNTILHRLTFEATEKGDGKMYDYCGIRLGDTDVAPWESYAWRCRSVILGKGITYVGEFTCRNFAMLASVKMSNDVKEIGGFAFQNCQCLKSFQCPKNLEKIGEAAFAGAWLKEVKWNKKLSDIGREAFCRTKLSDVRLPNSVRIVGDHAFADNNKLKTMVLNGGLECLGVTVFEEDNHLECLRLGKVNPDYFCQDAFEQMNPKVVVEVPAEKYDEYKEMLYSHGLPETAKVVAY